MTDIERRILLNQRAVLSTMYKYLRAEKKYMAAESILDDLGETNVLITGRPDTAPPSCMKCALYKELRHIAEPCNSCWENSKLMSIKTDFKPMEETND